nr:hypothetical protein [uncultured Pseudogulbenkiania sp.]
MLNRILAVLLVIALTVALSVLVTIKGWGLEPKSWEWIIGGGVFGGTFLRMLGEHVLRSGKKDG